MSEPRAYFITFTCHGTWLHGDERGSVDKEHNQPSQPFLPPNPGLHRKEAESCVPYYMDEPRRKIALQALVDWARKKEWKLWAVHVRSNHIHIVITALGKEVERVMNELKAAISRKMNRAYPTEASQTRWTRHGSTRYLWKEDGVAAAVHYVLHGQGEPMASYDGTK